MPAAQASCTVAIASSRVVGPQTCPIPPPPRVRALMSPSCPKVLCCMRRKPPSTEGERSRCRDTRTITAMRCAATTASCGRRDEAGLAPPPLSWHDGQRDMGGVLRAVQNGLQRWLERGVLGHPPPRVGVPVEAGEVAAGHLHPYPMPRLEDVAGGPQVDRVAIRPARLHQAGSGCGVAVAGADDAVGEVAGAAVLAYVHQLGREVGIGGGGGGPEGHGNGPGDLHIALQGRRRVYQHVLPSLDLLLVIG